MDHETWRDVVGRPNYQVSDQGRVRSRYFKGCCGKPGTEWHLLRPNQTKQGYLRVSVVSRTLCFIHVLVLEAFVGPRPTGADARHLDGRPSNNCLSNLAWGSRAENVADARRHGTLIVGERCCTAILTDADVLNIRRRLQQGEKQSRIAAEYGVKQCTISNVRTGKHWKHLPLVVEE
jgi:hypothetical protein